MNRRERMKDQILWHALRLNKALGLGLDVDNAVKLCKQLHRLEIKAHRLAEDYCNGLIEVDKWETETDKILARVNKLTHYVDAGIPVIINGDPRGYALKIDAEYVAEHNLNIHRDMGGFGILAPEFDGTN